MFNNPYSNIYSPQASIDRINSQISELEKMKSQLPPVPIPQNPTNLTQNFQIAPNTNTNSIKYANSIEDVERDVVISDTPYFSKNMSVVWIKNTKGEIKSYELKEIIQKDEKDLMIESLQYQLDEMNKMIKEMKENAKSIDKHDDEPIEVEKSPSVSVSRTSKTKSK